MKNNTLLEKDSKGKVVMKAVFSYMKGCYKKMEKHWFFLPREDRIHGYGFKNTAKQI